jgi:hypothetical protein
MNNPTCYAARHSPLRGKLGQSRPGNCGPDREVDSSLDGPGTDRRGRGSAGPDDSGRVTSPRSEWDAESDVGHDRRRVGTGSKAIRGLVNSNLAGNLRLAGSEFGVLM